MKKIILSIGLIGLLGGCSLATGKTKYTVEPVIVGAEIVCCKITVDNSKDYDKLKFNLEKKPDGTMSVSLDEQGVSASDPLTIAADNQNKLINAVTSLIPLKGE